MVAQALAERAPALDRLGLVALKKVGLWQLRDRRERERRH